jgi:predicted enzyme related to lactoylglutathione lyase
MDAFMEDHPRGVHGGLRYDLAEFGLDGGDLRRTFAFYTDRFGVELES